MAFKSTASITNPNDLPRPAWMGQMSSSVATAGVAVRAGMGWIFELGIRPEMPFYLKKNLVLINILSFLGLISALPGTFILMMVGFDHPLTLLVVGVAVVCLVLALNGARLAGWAQAIFAFAPATILLTYILSELSSGSMADPLVYLLARQALCLALLLPIFFYGFDKSQRWFSLGVCVVAFLFFDVTSLSTGSPLFSGSGSLARGLFSILSMAQYAGLASIVLYMQNYTLHREQQRRISIEKLQVMAMRDGLTGLFNHKFMEQLISDAINRSRRSKTPLSLLVIDVDHFKQVNDTLGHNAGDRVLTSLTRLLSSGNRSTDYLGRWGGDELMLLLTDTNLPGALNVAEKLRARVAQTVFPQQKHLTISVGATAYQDGDTLVDMIERADAAMYRSKHSGRNRVEYQM